MTDANDLIMNAGGPPAAKFDDIGDTHKGKITALNTQQERDYDTEQPLFWPSGEPRMQPVISIVKDDGEEVRLFCKYAMTQAIKEALIAAGAQRLELGGVLTVKFASTEPARNPKHKPRKVFKAKYEAPAVIEVEPLDAEDLI